MNRALLIILLPLSACAATADGEWPSLARRPGEVTGASPAAAPAPAPVPATTGDTAAAMVAMGRVTEAVRDFEQVNTRWQRQRGETQNAVTAARGAAQSTPAWARAQLELTRLERVGAELSDLRDRMDAVAGDLALAGARGGNVAAALAEVGKLVERIETARDEHRRIFEQAQSGLSR